MSTTRMPCSAFLPAFLCFVVDIDVGVGVCGCYKRKGKGREGEVWFGGPMCLCLDSPYLPTCLDLARVFVNDLACVQ